MSVVGFDFGNNSCVIAVAQKGGIDVIQNEVSSRQTATMVAFGEKERYLGEPAATQFLRNIKNTIVNVKRLIGRKFNEPEVQQELTNCPFKVVQLSDNNIGIEVMYAGEKRVFTPTTITAMVFQKLKDITEKSTEKPCTDVVISAPGYWTDRQRRALLDASKIAGLNCLRVFNETTASALSYGIYKTNQFSDTEPTRVMFYDMGQTSTGVSVVEFLKGKLKVVSVAYDRNLGGRNFDELLVNHFLAEFKEKYKIDIKNNQKAFIRLEIACEKLKKLLNTLPEAPLNIDSLMNDIDVKGMMKRNEFESLISPLVERAMKPVQEALDAAGITSDKLHAVEITGGATRLVAVQNRLGDYLKKEISKTLNFEESVSRGCALQCAMLSPVFKVREFSVIDISMYPIKLSWKSPDSMIIDESKESAEIFSKSNVVPSSKMITLHKSTGIDLVAQYSDLSLLPTGTDPFIGKFSINDIGSKSGEPVKVRIKVKLDINGVFSVESAEFSETIETNETPEVSPQTEDKKSEVTPMQDTEQQIPDSPKEETPTKDETPKESTDNDKKEEKKKKKIRRISLKIQDFTSSITSKDLNILIEEEAKLVSADKLAIETAEKKNAVESYVYEMRGKLADQLSEFATDKEKESLSSLFEQTESWLYGEGEDTTKSAYSKKLDELKALGDPILKRKYEHDNRYEALNSIRSVIEQTRLTATTDDPKYDHIPKEEKDKILVECNATEKFITEIMMKQDKVPKNSNPVVTFAEINKKQSDLQKFSNTIMSRPKPKPKEPEKPKEEPKAETQKTTEEPKKEEQKKEQNPKVDGMDLD